MGRSRTSNNGRTKLEKLKIARLSRHVIECRKINRETCQKLKKQNSNIQTNLKQINLDSPDIELQYVKYPIKYINSEIITCLPMQHAKEKWSIFLIDTGAQISFFKINQLKNTVDVNKDEQLIITGAITNVKYTSLGVIKSTVQINKVHYEHEFHLVDDTLNIPSDGVLGSDFLRKFRCKIDYDQLKLEIINPIQRKFKTNIQIKEQNLVAEQIKEEIVGLNENKLDLNPSENESETKINNEIQKAFLNKNYMQNYVNEIKIMNKNLKLSENSQESVNLVPQMEKLLGQNEENSETEKKFNKMSQDKIYLKARTQNIIKFPFQGSKEILIDKQEIKPGILMANAITKAENGKINLLIMNTNLNDVEIDIRDLVLQTHNLNDFEVLKINYERDKVRERLKELREVVKLDHCNNEERNSIWEICKEYNELFYLPGDKLSSTNAVKHKIQLEPNTIPIHTKPYRLPHAQKEEADRQISELIKQGIIIPSKSPWNSPILVVPKKSDAHGNKKWRLVVDFKKVNDKTVFDSYPLPNITDILDQLGKSMYFSTLDMASGYWQIEMDEKSREITAFQANYKFWEWNRMPFGLKNAPSTFQRLMNNVLTGLQGIQCLVYLDDIVIYGKSLMDHNIRLINVFKRLLEHNLKLQPEKCQFLCREIRYLGHIINKRGIRPDPNKIEAVQKFPIPKTVRQVKSFLGLASYYRKFIENFSKTSEPINKLLKKDTKFKWDAKCDEAFELLKEKLITPPILAFPILDQEYTITTDASQTSVGAVLSQEHEINGIKADLPICYMSRTLNQAERKYAVIEKELLGVVYALKQFRPYVYGRKCVIVTDHKPLVWLMKLKNPSSRLMRWKLELSEYEFDIIHKPGILNSNADALSRIEITPEQILGTEPEQNKVEIKFPDKLIEKCYKVITRSKTRQQELDRDPPELMDEQSSQENSENSEEESENESENESELLNKNKENLIIENKMENLIKKDFEMIVYFMSHKNDEMTKQIQIADLCENEIGKIHPYKKNEIVIFLPEKCGKETDLNNIKTVAKNLKIFIEQRKINSLAIRIPEYESEFYFSLKQILENTFQNLSTQITFFVDKIIQIEQEADKENIIKGYHELPLGGHLGINNTIAKIRRRYQWPNMNKDIMEYIQKCIKCKKTKTTTHTKLPMKIISPATRVYQKLHMDIVGPISMSEKGNKYILTFQDDLSKYAEAVAMPDVTAYTMAENFVNTIICRHAIPEILVTDQGTVFLSKMFQEICKLLKIKHITTSAYRPQSNGQIERYHRSLSQYIKAFAETDLNNWDKWIPYALLVYNTTKQASTNFTPHELVYGFNVDIPTNLKTNTTVTYNYDNYITLLKNRLRHSHEMARENILKSKETSKKYYDRNVKFVKFEKGDMVMTLNEVKTHKYAPVYSGPYPIIEILTDETSLVQIGRKTKRFHNNKLKLV